MYFSSAMDKNEYISPVNKSMINDVNGYLKILCDRIPNDTESLIIAENTMERNEIKKEILGYLMEKRICNSILFVRSGILDCFSYGKTTGLIVSLGGGSTQVCSVIDGFITCRKQLEIGGFDLTLEFKNVLISSGINFSRLINVNKNDMWYEKRIEFEKNEISRYIKEEVCNLNMEGIYSSSYEIYTGESIELNENGRTIPYKLIEVSKLIIEVIEMNNLEIRANLIGNIILVGGGTGIKGIDNAICSQLDKERPKWKSKVIMEKNQFNTFQGGSIIGSMGSIKNLHIGINDYEEYGENILERKKCDWLLEITT